MVDVRDIVTLFDMISESLYKNFIIIQCFVHDVYLSQGKIRLTFAPPPHSQIISNLCCIHRLIYGPLRIYFSYHFLSSFAVGV